MQVPLTSLDQCPNHVRPATVLLAAWTAVLSRHTSSADVISFTSFRGDDPWIAPFRTVIPPKSAVAEWLTEIEAQLTETEETGPMPGQVIAQMKEEGIDRTAPTFFVVPADAQTFPPRDEIRSPLLVLARLDIGMIELHYDSSWFDAEEVRALGDHLNRVLEGMSADPAAPVGKLPLLTPAEITKVLDTWNDTQVPFEENTCVHQFFEAQVKRTPDAIAVVFCDKQWTYRELNARADRLAQRLRAAGVVRGTFVAICVERSLELMATLLAVHKAGGAYVPLDPSYPPERLAFMMEDAKPAVIAISAQTKENFSGSPHQLFSVEDDTANVPSGPVATASESSDAAYVLYTSGSTGKPKGVVVTHRNVSNFITAMDGVIGTDPGVWLAVTSVNFDISVFELFWTLARGFRIILQEEGQWVSQTGSMYSLPQQMRRHGVTHLQCTPSLASMLICDSASVEAISRCAGSWSAASRCRWTLRAGSRASSRANSGIFTAQPRRRSGPPRRS